MHADDETINHLARWAEGRADVRALIITSTRAIPGGQLDAYSDYDVIVVVDDVRSLADDTDWLTEFGTVLVAYWDPLREYPATGAVQLGSIVNYVNGLKIDFGLWSRQTYGDVTAGPEPHPEFDAGCQVVVDKDGLTAELPEPTFAAYIPRRPDEAAYLRVITDFLIGVPYVAKGLLRDELLPTKWVLDFDMRFNYLVPMLEWRVQCDHQWSLKTGNLGKGLTSHLAPDVRSELERTFTGADPEANWDALFVMITLFGRIAREVADLLGFTYPDDLVTRVAAHATRMRRGDFAAGPLPSD